MLQIRQKGTPLEKSYNASVGGEMRSLQICILFVCALTVTSTNLIDFHTSNTTESNDIFLKSAIDCISIITNKYMPCGTLIMLISTMTNMDPLIEYLSNNNCYQFVVRSFQTQNWLILSDIYITSMKDFSEFQPSFKNLTRDKEWNPDAQFIILIYELNITERNDVFKFLMMLNVFNVFLVTKSENNVEVNTYNPFDNNACGRSFNEVKNINNCDDIDSIKTDYRHIEIRLRNCTINIVGIEDIPNFIYPTNKLYSFIGKYIEGIEQYMLSNIAKQENLTLNYTLAESGNFGMIMPNWTVTGALGYLDNNTVDIAVGGFLVLKNRMDLFDCIWGYSYTSFYLFTPVIDDAIWKKVYQPFSVTTWILIFVSFCLVTIVSKFSNKYFAKIFKNKNCLALTFWGYFFGNVNSKLIRTKKLRIILILWIWFTFFVTSFYNTAFYSLLTAKSKENFNYFNKTLKSLPFKPCISENIRDFFLFRYNITLPGETNDKCNTTEMALNTVANSKKFYALEKKYSYDIREFQFIDEEGNRKLDAIRYTGFLNCAIYIRRGYPLQEKLRRYARYHRESGILKYHRRLIFHRHDYLKKLGPSFITLDLDNFKIHFGVLFFGYIVSFISFVIETKYDHRRQRD